MNTIMGLVIKSNRYREVLPRAKRRKRYIVRRTSIYKTPLPSAKMPELWIRTFDAILSSFHLTASGWR